MANISRPEAPATGSGRLSLPRRGFLGAAGGLSAAALLAACSANSGGSSSGGGVPTIEFWDMPWGAATYPATANKVISQYKGATVKYQTVSWENWFQTYASAVQSRTPPSISTGGSFMPFQFAAEGAMASLDPVYKKLQANGVASDFLPGTIEALRYKGTLVGVPWSVEARMLWYRSDLLAKANVAVPTNWTEFRSACAALKKQGIYGYAIPGNLQEGAYQHVFPWIINNGGGFFNAAGEPDCVTDRNIEAVEFLQSLVKDNYLNPDNVSSTRVQNQADFVAGRLAMINQPSGADKQTLQGTTGKLGMMSPLVGPHGDKGTLYWVQPVMKYNNGGDSAATDEFIIWWMTNIQQLFASGQYGPIPARKSFQSSPFVKDDPFYQKEIAEWIPVGKSVGANAAASFPLLNSVEGARPTAIFSQQVVQAQLSPRQMLQQYQNALESMAG